MTGENIWAWLQAKGKIFKVISNPNKGTIEVLDENGETLIRRTNLSRRQVELVEKNFLNFVAKRLNNFHSNNREKPPEGFDPMIT